MRFFDLFALFNRLATEQKLAEATKQREEALERVFKSPDGQEVLNFLHDQREALIYGQMNAKTELQAIAIASEVNCMTKLLQKFTTISVTPTKQQ